MRLVEVQLAHLVRKLDPSNEVATKEEIAELIRQFGNDAAEHYCFCLLKNSIPDGTRVNQSIQATFLTSYIINGLSTEDGAIAVARAFTRWVVYLQQVNQDALKAPLLLEVMQQLKIGLLDQILLSIACLSGAHRFLQLTAATALQTRFPQAQELPSFAQTRPSALQRILSTCTEGKANELRLKVEDIRNFRKAVMSGLTPQTADASILPLLTPSDPDVLPLRSHLPNPEKETLSNFAMQIEPYKLLLEVGYEATCHVDAAVEFFKMLPRGAYTSISLGRCIGAMASTLGGDNPGVGLEHYNQVNFKNDDTESKDWNLDNFMKAVIKLNLTSKWEEIAKGFDFEDFELKDVNGLSMILMAHKYVTQSTFPINLLLGPWKNAKAQLSVLKLLVDPNLASHNDVTELLTALKNRVSLEGLRTSADARLVPWLCLDLVSALLRLGDTMAYSEVLSLFQSPMKNYPDILVIALASIDSPSSTGIQENLIGLLLNVFFNHNPNSTVVLQRIWDIKPSLLLRGMLNWYLNNDRTSCLARILDIAQDMKCLDKLLGLSDYNFVVELAVLASKREFLNLEGWLKSRLQQQRVEYAKACMTFMSRRMRPDLEQRQPEVIQTMERCLDLIASQLPRDIGATYMALKQHIAQILFQSAPVSVASPSRPQQSFSVPPTPERQPELTLQSPPGLATSPSMSVPEPRGLNMALLTRGVASGDFGAVEDLTSQSFSHAVDHRANLNFKKIYQGQMDVEEVIQMLQNLRQSPAPEDQQVFACMIRNLFDEYQFFTQYPEKELKITGALFGALISNRLVSGRTLGVAIQYIVDAVNTTPSDRMFAFATRTLERLQSSLHNFKELCVKLKGSPNFDALPRDIVTSIKSIIDGKVEADFPKIGPDALESPTDPPATVSQKVSVVFNNLSESNMETKQEELATVLKPEHYPWFAQYLLKHRVVSQANNHSLYVNFLAAFQSEELEAAVLKATLAHVGSIFIAEKVEVATSPDRKAIGHIGHWLGLQTIARNKPLLHKDLPLKNALIAAYKKGMKWLLMVVPFSTKLLETSLQSAIFQPPNPWTMACLRVLKEIHGKSQAKIALQLDIELLYKNLDMDLESVDSRDLLTRTLKPSPSFSGQSPILSINVPEFKPRHVTNMTLMNSYGGSNQSSVAPQTPFGQMQSGNKSTLHQYLEFKDTAAQISRQPPLKAAIIDAIDKAIDTILQPVVERSVKIACTCCHRLVAKDFCHDADINRLRAAAHNMVRHLAGRFASVTAKEPLLAQIFNHVKTVLERTSPVAQNASDVVSTLANTVADENINACIAFIELSARDKATSAIDEALKESYQQRQMFHHQHSGQPFQDSSVAHADAIAKLPRQLKPSFEAPNSRHWELYRSYSTVPVVTAAPSVPNSSSLNAQAPAFNMPKTPNRSSNPTVAEPVSPRQAPPGLSPHPQPELRAHLENRLNEAMRVLAVPGPQNSQNIQASIQNLVAHVVGLGQTSRDAFLVLIELAVNGLFSRKFPPPAMLMLLAAIKERFPPQPQATIQIIAADEDDRRLQSSQVFSQLAILGLVDLAQLDAFMTKIMQNGRNSTAILFVEDFLRHSVLAAPTKRIPPTQFKSCIAALKSIASSQNPSRERQVALLTAIEKLPPPHLGQGRLIKEDPQDPPQMNDQVARLFEEWTAIAPSARIEELATTQYIRKLTGTVLSSGELSARFFRMCADLAVQLCFTVAPVDLQAQGWPQEPEISSFAPVDIFCNLVLMLLTHFGESTKVALVKKVLSTVTQVVLREHTVLGPRFNQKPFHRIFVRLLTNVGARDEDTNVLVLTAFSQAFHALRPSAAPGFSFAWLELISHKVFMPNLLLNSSQPNSKSVHLFHALIMDLLIYLQPFLLEGQLDDSLRILYKGTLRIFLVLLHDFPEFLCENHFSFCDVIPPSCVQLRNLVLSAFPRDVKMSNPKELSSRDDTSHVPRIMSSVSSALESAKLLDSLKQYLQDRKDVTFISSLPQRLQIQQPSPGHPHPACAFSNRYNVPLINSLVLFTGMSAISTNPTDQTIMHSAHMDIFHALVSLDAEGRYFAINAIVNQLRYPNTHTKYFHRVLLSLFTETSDDVRETITRVLTERVVANRPHPWGLYFTLVDLIKNEKYDFWNYSFVRKAPQVESVLRILQQPPVPSASRSHSSHV